MIENFITELGPWSWWVLGFIFLIIEVLAPGVFFLWFGLAAVLVGTAALLLPLAWQTQVIVFSILSLVLLVVGRRIYARFSKKETSRSLNERGQYHIGKTYPLAEDLKNGQGRVRIGDTLWLVHGTENLETGHLVKVTAAEGTILTVEKA